MTPEENTAANMRTLEVMLRGLELSLSTKTPAQIIAQQRKNLAETYQLGYNDRHIRGLAEADNQFGSLQ